MYKKYFLNFQSIQSRFFYLFCFGMYKMVYSEYSKDINKSAKLVIGKVMRNPEMSRLVPDHPKTKKQRKYAVKKLPYLLRYILDQY